MLPDQKSLGQKTILIVDDDEPILRVLQTVLSLEERYRIVTARDGRQAIDMAEKELPDLILMDVMMPNVDGLEACRTIRANPLTKHIKIVMVSAMAQPIDADRALCAGATDYVTKPFLPSTLLLNIERWLQ